ncbi:MAG: nucleotidyltransferase domain-containing protein [Candidatus Altiarchaeales archaeon HGW-Altiarchaeales-2]|nr:MAG: nucleotidyltransferase domain-containing protein [Candidatus Altiarchaeales archaeon HGW-Altiarchaeales-2]
MTLMMVTKIEKALEKIKGINGFEYVKFIMLYGSAAKGQTREHSDIDISIYYDRNNEECSRFRFSVLSELFDEYYDVHIFQQLPLYVRADVLKGNILYCQDKNFLYDTSIVTIKDFEAFKHRLYDYIGEKTIK